MGLQCVKYADEHCCICIIFSLSFVIITSSLLSIQFAITLNRRATSIDESQKMKETNSVLEYKQRAWTVNCDQGT